MKFSASTMGFYGEDFPEERRPADAVDVSDERYQACQHKLGDVPRELKVDADGLPFLSDVVPVVAPLADRIAAAGVARQAAYVAESDPLFFKWQRGDATREEWLAKIEEIKARIPDPTA